MTLDRLMAKFLEYEMQRTERWCHSVMLYADLSGRIKTEREEDIFSFDKLDEAYEWLEQQTKGKSHE